jgi:2'-5' RNA ligase
MSNSQEKAPATRSETLRLFLCIDLPDEVKDQIGSLQQRLRKIDASVSWTRPSNVHLTLKFLGSVPKARVGSVCRATEEAATAINEFDIEVAGTGCFPSTKNPRVFWIGLQDLPHELIELHTAVERAFEREGFDRETRNFSPHLTIGRMRGPHNARLVAEQLVLAGFGPFQFRAREVIAMQSTLNPAGSIYTPLCRHSFKMKNY